MKGQMRLLISCLIVGLAAATSMIQVIEVGEPSLIQVIEVGEENCRCPMGRRLMMNEDLFSCENFGDTFKLQSTTSKFKCPDGKSSIQCGGPGYECIGPNGQVERAHDKINDQGCAWVNTLKCGESCQKNKCNDKSARECNWDNGKCHDADETKPGMCQVSDAGKKMGASEGRCTPYKTEKQCAERPLDMCSWVTEDDEDPNRPCDGQKRPNCESRQSPCEGATYVKAQNECSCDKWDKSTCKAQKTQMCKGSPMQTCRMLCDPSCEEGQCAMRSGSCCDMNCQAISEESKECPASEICAMGESSWGMKHPMECEGSCRVGDGKGQEMCKNCVRQICSGICAGCEYCEKEDPCAGKECGDVCSTGGGSGGGMVGIMVVSYCQPSGNFDGKVKCGMKSDFDCECPDGHMACRRMLSQLPPPEGKNCKWVADKYDPCVSGCGHWDCEEGCDFVASCRRRLDAMPPPNCDGELEWVEDNSDPCVEGCGEYVCTITKKVAVDWCPGTAQTPMCRKLCLVGPMCGEGQCAVMTGDVTCCDNYECREPKPQQDCAWVNTLKCNEACRKDKCNNHKSQKCMYDNGKCHDVDECKPVTCKMACENGWQKNKAGCDMCKCAKPEEEDPCEDLLAAECKDEMSCKWYEEAIVNINSVESISKRLPRRLTSMMPPQGWCKKDPCNGAVVRCPNPGAKPCNQAIKVPAANQCSCTYWDDSDCEEENEITKCVACVTGDRRRLTSMAIFKPVTEAVDNKMKEVVEKTDMVWSAGSCQPRCATDDAGCYTSESSCKSLCPNKGDRRDNETKKCHKPCMPENEETGCEDGYYCKNNGNNAFFAVGVCIKDENDQGCAWVNTLKYGTLGGAATLCGESCQKNKCNDKSARECNWDNGKCHDADATEKCKPVLCEMFCEHGWAQNDMGCDICKCKKASKCSEKKCGDVCATSGRRLTSMMMPSVMKYCQADGSCGMNAVPKCEDASKCSERCTNDPCCGCDDSGNEMMSGCPAPPICANGQEARAPKGTCCAGPQDCESDYPDKRCPAKGKDGGMGFSICMMDPTCNVVGNCEKMGKICCNRACGGLECVDPPSTPAPTTDTTVALDKCAQYSDKKAKCNNASGCKWDGLLEKDKLGCITDKKTTEHNCMTKETWSAEKTKWCCANKQLGCPQVTEQSGCPLAETTKRVKCEKNARCAFNKGVCGDSDDEETEECVDPPMCTREQAMCSDNQTNATRKKCSCEWDFSGCPKEAQACECPMPSAVEQDADMFTCDHLKGNAWQVVPGVDRTRCKKKWMECENGGFQCKNSKTDKRQDAEEKPEEVECTLNDGKVAQKCDCKAKWAKKYKKMETKAPGMDKVQKFNTKAAKKCKTAIKKAKTAMSAKDLQKWQKNITKFCGQKDLSSWFIGNCLPLKKSN